MGLLEKIFGKNPQPQKGNDGFFTTLNAYTPAFTTWGGQIYESDLADYLRKSQAERQREALLSPDGQAGKLPGDY